MSRLRAALALAVHYLRLTLSDRQTLLLFFALPLLFTLVLGEMFAGSSPPGVQRAVAVHADAVAAVGAGRLAGVPGLDTTAGADTAAVVIRPAAGDGATLEIAGPSTLTRPLALLLSLPANPAPGAPAVHVREAEDAEAGPPERWRIARGMIAMFALFLMFSGGISLVEDRETGLLPRLRVTAASDAAVLGGKLLGVLVTGLVQMTILLVATRLLFAVSWGRSPAALVLVVVAFCLAGTAIGMALATFARTADQAENLGVLSVLALSALGGAWWPLEDAGPLARQVAPVSPVYWGVEALEQVMVAGAGIAGVLTPLAALLAFAAAGFALAVARLARQRE